jgi:hypothetical protein
MTAVEWLEDEIRWYISNDDRLYDMFKKAKEMEKKQIMDAYETELYQYKTEISAEEYYNETFKTKQND